MMYTTNGVFVDLGIMDVVFVISLTPKPFRPASSPAPACFLYGGDITVVSFPSLSQAIHV